jgi:hypothetical protein
LHQAQDQSVALAAWQARECFVELSIELNCQVTRGVCSVVHRRLALTIQHALASALTHAPRMGLERHLDRHAIKPWREPICITELLAPPHEHKERGLERVLNIVTVPENPPANSHHHWTMTHQERLECRRVPMTKEPLE